jgi:transposase
MRKIREVLRLSHELGASRREIALSVGIARSTVSEYLYRAEGAKLAWPLPEGLSDEDLARRLFPPAPGPDQPPRPVPDWAEIDRELMKKGVTLLLVWLEYKERLGESAYGYSRFADLYNQWKGKTDLRMLQHHKAGEKLFADFAGLTMPVTDPGTGELRQVPIFTSAMGASQRIFAQAQTAQTTQCWLSGLDEAFSFYGALCEVVVPDNPKACVSSPDRYEPAINPSFAEFAQFYGLAVIPARVRKPRDKAKVENAVLQVERWVLAPLRNQTFFSIEELNEAIRAKVLELDARVMKGYGMSRRELFEQVDLPAMRELPQNRYSFASWKRAKVAPDYHVEFEGHRYSVPHQMVGKRVDIRITDGTVEVFAAGNRIFTHVRSLARRGFTTEPSHRPKGHGEYAEWTPERIVKWALAIGPSVSELVCRIMDGKVHPEQAFRSCLGIISLEKTYGKERVEAGSARALRFGAHSRRSLQTILQKGLDQEPGNEPETARVLHANLRGGNYYSEATLCAN